LSEGNTVLHHFGTTRVNAPLFNSNLQNYLLILPENFGQFSFVWTTCKWPQITFQQKNGCDLTHVEIQLLQDTTELFSARSFSTAALPSTWTLIKKRTFGDRPLGLLKSSIPRSKAEQKWVITNT